MLCFCWPPDSQRGIFQEELNSVSWVSTALRALQSSGSGLMAGGHRGRGSVRGRECEIGGGRVDRNLFLLCDGGTLVHFLAEKAEKEKKIVPAVTGTGTFSLVTCSRW